MVRPGPTLMSSCLQVYTYSRMQSYLSRETWEGTCTSILQDTAHDEGVWGWIIETRDQSVGLAQGDRLLQGMKHALVAFMTSQKREGLGAMGIPVSSPGERWWRPAQGSHCREGRQYQGKGCGRPAPKTVLLPIVTNYWMSKKRIIFSNQMAIESRTEWTQRFSEKPCFEHQEKKR